MDRRGFLVDVVVALAAFGISAAVLAGSDVEPGVRQADALAYALLTVYSGSVAVRRIRPVLAVAAALAAGLAYAAAGYPLALSPVAVLSVYTAATSLPERTSRRVLLGSVVAAALGTSVAPGPTDTGIPLVVACAWFLGHTLRTRRLYTEELEAKNRELEAAQHELARQAVTEERLRIARELHDVVAHSMSVVAVHAGSGRMVAARDPVAAERALETIETTTRAALGEMRRLLGVLRAGGAGGDGPEPGDLGPAPGLEDLGTLVEDVRRSGVEVDLRVDGERPLVPAGIGLSAYRVVQEALTNVIRHAGPARAVVRVRYTDTEVTVEVDDDGRGPAAGNPVAANSGGHGLVGMRERVAVHGGELEVGPRPTGGFHVAARFPVGR